MYKYVYIYSYMYINPADFSARTVLLNVVAVSKDYQVSYIDQSLNCVET